MPEPKWVYDGNASFASGMHGGRSPSAIGEDQVAYGYNVTFRGGFPRHRPKLIALDYLRTNVETSWWLANRFQGAAGYTDMDGKGHVFVSVGGRLYRFALDEYLPLIEEESTIALRNNPNNEQVWFCKAENYLIAQDGRSAPWVWDGVSLSRIPAGNNFPVGTRMAYGIGRIWVAQGSSYYGGDLVDSDPSLGKASILRFTENEFLNTGGAFHTPTEAGPITGLAFTAKQDTASGQGSLMVFTRGGIFEFEAPVDRELWAQLEQPLQRFSLLNFGATSHESIVPVNGDLFFRSSDGVRSFYFARRDFGSWGNTPISSELGKITSKDQQYWLRFCKGVMHDNRLLMTVDPDLTTTGPVWNKLVSLDFDLISSMGQKSPPAWEGEWEFADPIFSIVTVACRTGDRCIVITKDQADGIAFYELARDGQFSTESVTWGFDSRAYMFQLPRANKRLHTFESWWDESDAAGNVDVWWRPNASGCWAPWGRYASTLSTCVSAPTGCAPPVFGGPQAMSRVGLPIAPDVFDSVNCMPKRDGYSHQIRLRTTASATLKMLVLGAEVLDQAPAPTFDAACTTLDSDCQTC